MQLDTSNQETKFYIEGCYCRTKQALDNCFEFRVNFLFLCENSLSPVRKFTYSVRETSIFSTSYASLRIVTNGRPSWTLY